MYERYFYKKERYYFTINYYSTYNINCYYYVTYLLQ